MVEASPELVSVLQKYHWPGNIRELENVIKRYVRDIALAGSLALAAAACGGSTGVAPSPTQGGKIQKKQAQ